MAKIFKTKKSIVFTFIAVIVVSVIVVNFQSIMFLVRLFNLKNSTANSDVELNERPVNPIGSFIVIDDSDENTDEQVTDNTKPTTEPTPSNTEETPKNDDQNPTYEQIVIKYYNRLSALEEDYEKTLNNLISQARNEYLSLGDNPSNLSLLNLANKYSKLGSELEQNCDRNFNKVIKEMEDELKAHSYSTDIVTEAKNYYKGYKKFLYTDIFEKADEYL